MHQILLSAIFFFFFSKNNFQNFSGIPSEFQTNCIKVRPDILSGLIWYQTIYKNYWQITIAGINFFLNASSNFCRLLITFANSFGSEQDQQNVGTDLNSNCLTL